MEIRYEISGLVFENICDIVVEFKNEYVVYDYICDNNILYIELKNDNEQIIMIGDDNIKFKNFTAEKALELYNKIIKIIEGK